MTPLAIISSLLFDGGINKPWCPKCTPSKSQEPIRFFIWINFGIHGYSLKHFNWLNIGFRQRKPANTYKFFLVKDAGFRCLHSSQKSSTAFHRVHKTVTAFKNGSCPVHWRLPFGIERIPASWKNPLGTVHQHQIFKLINAMHFSILKSPTLYDKDPHASSWSPNLPPISRAKGIGYMCL